MASSSRRTSATSQASRPAGSAVATPDSAYLAHLDAVLFFGPVLPHAQTISRLLRSLLDNPPSAALAGIGADLRALPALLAAHPSL